jgi:hypothetical protein
MILNNCKNYADSSNSIGLSGVLSSFGENATSPLLNPVGIYYIYYMTLTTNPHLAPMLKKEYSYTSSPPLDLRGMLRGELLYIC